MDENVVVEAVCFELKRQGYTIVGSLTTVQQGIDVVARNDRSGEEVFVEAKGGTSSRQGSARFGRPYTHSQVFDRVAKGVFTCIQLRSQRPDRSKQRVMLAVPECPRFRSYLEPVMPQLGEAGIEVWFAPVPESNRP